MCTCIYKIWKGFKSIVDTNIRTWLWLLYQLKIRYARSPLLYFQNEYFKHQWNKLKWRFLTCMFIAHPLDKHNMVFTTSYGKYIFEFRPIVTHLTLWQVTTLGKYFLSFKFYSLLSIPTTKQTALEVLILKVSFVDFFSY